jgi:hypothetical protein
LPSGGLFVLKLPRLALHWINNDSAGNYHSWTRNHQKNDYSAENYQLIDEESTGRMVILTGITCLGKRNPPQGWDSLRKKRLMEADTGRRDQNVRKILRMVTVSLLATLYPLYYESCLK